MRREVESFPMGALIGPGAGIGGGLGLVFALLIGADRGQAIGTPGGPRPRDLRPCRQRRRETMLIGKEREPDDERT